jgi:hypothetical protein
MKMRILGIDLAGKEENETGICILDGDKFIYPPFILTKRF